MLNEKILQAVTPEGKLDPLGFLYLIEDMAPIQRVMLHIQDGNWDTAMKILQEATGEKESEIKNALRKYIILRCRTNWELRKKYENSALLKGYEDQIF